MQLEELYIKYEKLYEAYSLPHESMEDFIHRYTEEQQANKEINEIEKGMEDYYEQR